MRQFSAIALAVVTLILSQTTTARNAKMLGDISLVQPIQGDPNVDIKLARIGWHLFRDPQLSSSGNVSCATCHNLQTNGAENTPVSTGVKGDGIRNSITVFNTALNYRFLWDGTENTLMAQIDGPIHNPMEMDSNWQTIEQYVKESEHYQALFNRDGELPINVHNIKSAIVEFVEGLQTPGAPFDAYLLGYTHVLSEQQIRGWKTFQTSGCVQCHQGKNIGGAMIQRFAYFKDKPVVEDLGRQLVTIEDEERFYFRVASLRNVALTSPYFHNGQVDKLSDAIQIMAKTQLGITMNDENVADIEAFLQSLTAPRPIILEVLENE
ncbi:c-type cytochrome [Vibrio alginolyticus]|nr:c-type cytochrome [Vibrio alginolyticus]